MISIHTLLAVSDVFEPISVSTIFYFYPHSPCGERPLCLITAVPNSNFYPHSPCGERLNSFSLNINGPLFLSTLSLR